MNITHEKIIRSMYQNWITIFRVAVNIYIQYSNKQNLCEIRNADGNLSYIGNVIHVLVVVRRRTRVF